MFDYQETRGACHAKDFLLGFKGYLQTDAYSGYEWIADKKEMVGMNCNAYGRRPFALSRKNWLFAGSPAGAKAGAILYSLLQSQSN